MPAARRLRPRLLAAAGLGALAALAAGCASRGEAGAEVDVLIAGGEIYLGDGSAPEVDIAVDPIDGTTLTSLGRPNAISVIALSERGTMFDPGPCVYMEKIAVGPEAGDAIDITAPVSVNLASVAKALGKDLDDVTAVILDRDRHADRRPHRQAGDGRGPRRDERSRGRRPRASGVDVRPGEPGLSRAGSGLRRDPCQP